MIRTKWTDISPDWADYQEARVQALAEENKSLRRQVQFLSEIRKFEQQAFADDVEMPSVLVPGLPLLS